MTNQCGFPQISAFSNGICQATLSNPRSPITRTGTSCIWCLPQTRPISCPMGTVPTSRWSTQSMTKPRISSTSSRTVDGCIMLLAWTTRRWFRLPSMMEKCGSLITKRKRFYMRLLNTLESFRLLAFQLMEPNLFQEASRRLLSGIRLLGSLSILLVPQDLFSTLTVIALDCFSKTNSEPGEASEWRNWVLKITLSWRSDLSQRHSREETDLAAAISFEANNLIYLDLKSSLFA